MTFIELCSETLVLNLKKVSNATIDTLKVGIEGASLKCYLVSSQHEMFKGTTFKNFCFGNSSHFFMSVCKANFHLYGKVHPGRYRHNHRHCQVICIQVFAISKI